MIKIGDIIKPTCVNAENNNIRYLVEDYCMGRYLLYNIKTNKYTEYDSYFENEDIEYYYEKEN